MDVISQNRKEEKNGLCCVYLSDGDGKITINKKGLSCLYFPTGATLQYKVKQAFTLTLKTRNERTM